MIVKIYKDRVKLYTHAIYKHTHFYPELWDKRRPDRWAWRRLDTYEEHEDGKPGDALAAKCLDVAAKYSPELHTNVEVTVKHQIEASAEFKEQFERLRKLEVAVPAEITVEENAEPV